VNADISIGVGSASSAIIGANIVRNIAKMLQIPNADAQTAVGNKVGVTK
jgi:hypothetical protein